MTRSDISSLSRAELEAEVRRLQARDGENREAFGRQSPEASVQRQRAVFSSAVDIAMIVTNREGNITDWNTGAEHIFGWSADEMYGQGADCFFTPEDRAEGRVASEMRLAMEDGRASDERWHLRKDGSRFWPRAK